MRILCTELVLIVIVLVSSFFSAGSLWLMLAMAISLGALFVVNGLNKIPADPIHKGLLTFLGRRQEVVLKEGWNFFPLRPFVFDFILIKTEKVSDEIPRQEVRTPDRALVTMTSSVTWTPGIAEEPSSYLMYLNCGGEVGVKKIMRNVIEDRIKTWASSNKEGPANWEEAQSLRDSAHAVLAKALLGTVLPDVTVKGKRSPIPTSTWMRFFDKPQSEPAVYDIKHSEWVSKDPDGKANWDGLMAIFNAYSDAEKEELEKQIEKRRQDIKNLREGTANFGHPSLGITIHQFTVNELMVGGSVAEAADKAEKERNEQEADITELKNVSDRIAELRERHKEMSIEEAIRLVQTERGKVNKSVIEVIGASTGLGKDVLAAFKQGK